VLSVDEIATLTEVGERTASDELEAQE
jgi:hypothetical protein